MNVSFLFLRCIQWYVIERGLWFIPIFQGVITLFVIMNFSLATFMDPGVIPRGEFHLNFDGNGVFFK